MDLKCRNERVKLISSLVNDVNVREFKEKLKDFILNHFHVDISELCDGEFCHYLSVFDNTFGHLLTEDQKFDAELFFRLCRSFYFEIISLNEFVFVHSDLTYKFSNIYLKIRPYLQI